MMIAAGSVMEFEDIKQITLKEYLPDSFTWIDTESQLQLLSAHLFTQHTLGVDLENHHQTSYNGFLCLIQITTPNYETYLIDAVKLRLIIKQYLGSQVFENKQIVKVFHGCLHSDVGWLQRDFGIQVTNVFDTQEAFKALLKGPNLSLTHLWGSFCRDHHKYSKQDKQHFQTADWSARPLPLDMLNYAAHDSHFLIYIAWRIQ